MGNILKCFIRCFDGEDDDSGSGDHYPCSYRPPSRVQLHFSPQNLDHLKVPLTSPPRHRQPPHLPPPLSHRVSRDTVAIAALKLDLPSFKPISTVPEGPKQYITSSRKVQVKWCIDEEDDGNGKPYCLNSRPEYHHGSVPSVTSRIKLPPIVPNGVAALERDLLNFAMTFMVPEGLAQHVASSKKAQVVWYKKMLDAYKAEKHPPRTSADAAMLVATALSRIERINLEGVLAFYGFPTPTIPTEGSENHPSPIPDGVLFVLNTLPVNAKCIVDGDGFTAYVDAVNPIQVREDVNAWGNSKKQKRANDLQTSLQNSGQKKMIFSGREILARKYEIRLRGIDAPEMKMKYGKESQDALVKLIAWKSVTLHIYGQDQFNRYVCDIYCGRVFIQEQMLLNGHAWHFKNYDKRPEFEMWEKKAQAARRGLWAYDNPEKPWEWRKNKRARHSGVH